MWVNEHISSKAQMDIFAEERYTELKINTAYIIIKTYLHASFRACTCVIGDRMK